MQRLKALCAGNPLIKEKMDLDVQVAKLKVLKADHQSQKFRLEDKLLTKIPGRDSGADCKNCSPEISAENRCGASAGQGKLLRHGHQGHDLRRRKRPLAND